MGFFSTVKSELDCERCHSPFSTGVQFYGDDDRELPEYLAGQVVPALSPDSTYEGLADSFCAVCMKQWTADEKVANFTALARSIADCEVIARFATYQADLARCDLGKQLKLRRDAPLTPLEVLRLADTPEHFEQSNFPFRLHIAQVVLFRGQLPIDDDPGSTWWSDHKVRVRQLLAAQGWRDPAEDDSRGVTVRVDSGGVISVLTSAHPESSA